MKQISMQKIIYVSDGKHIPYIRRYNQLENELQNDNKIEVIFCKGDYNRRIKQLQNIGYNLISWIWKPTESSPIYSEYKGIFSR